MIYKSNDGYEFESEEDCKEYEELMEKDSGKYSKLFENLKEFDWTMEFPDHKGLIVMLIKRVVVNTLEEEKQ